MAICPGCGEENPDRFRLCGFCGTPLAAAPPVAEVRKTVTVLFSDLKGSTRLGELLDPESLREVMDRYFTEVRRMIERHGGMVEKFIGDAVMAVFGLPTAHEEDALRAVRAAWDMKQALAELNEELERRWGVTLAHRTGVNTGEVVANAALDRQRLVTGDTVNVAARLEQAAPELEILIGEPTHRLVRDAVSVAAVEPLELKGKSEALPAFRVLGVRSGAMLARRPDAPLVGRRSELARLRAALDEAVASRSARLITVLAEPGVGKSRLVREFLAGCSDITVLHGGCLSYGEGITFWPLAEAIRSWAGISDDFTADEAASRLARLPCSEQVQARIASIMGLGAESFSLDEMFWAVRELLRGAAGSSGAVIVVLDDMHWAEQTLLDLITWLMDGATDVPVLLLATARPHLMESQPLWGDGPGCARLRLLPLQPAEAAAVAENALGAALDLDVRTRIVAAAEGNPLFVEQMLSMLIDDGLVVQGAGGWVATGDLTRIEMPATIHALLTARVDHLPAEERRALEAGAVIGRLFYRDAVERMTDGGTSDVDAQLGALIRKEYVEPAHTMLLMGDTFQFLHGLIRDAVYRGLLKRRRAELHLQIAEWVTAIVGDRLPEYEEIIGYHLEHAARYRTELGTLDDETRRLGHRAADHLGEAGRRSLARGDMSTAAGLLMRAREALPSDDARRLRFVFDLVEVLVEQGEFDQADTVLDESERQAAALGDASAAREIRLARLVQQFTVTPESWSEEVRAEIEQAVAHFEAVGNHMAVAKGWRLLGTVFGARCQYGEAERAVEATIRHARLAGDPLLELRNLAPFAFIALAGPMPVADALERCRGLIGLAGDDRRTQEVIRCAVAQLQAMEGRFDEARASYRSARQTLDELGVKVLAASVSLNAGPAELLAGDPAAAERELRHDADALVAMGERYLLPCVIAYLSQAVLELRRIDEADELSTECASLAAEDDIEAQVIWRRVRARVLAESGFAFGAIELAQEAVSIAESTDSPCLRADSLVDLAVVLQRSGNPAAAAAKRDAALALYEAKGSVVAAARLRPQAARPATPARLPAGS